MGEALVYGAPWDGRSTVGGCVRDACVRAITTDVYEFKPSSLALWNCGQGAGWYLVDPGSRKDGVTALSLSYKDIYLFKR